MFVYQDSPPAKNGNVGPLNTYFQYNQVHSVWCGIPRCKIAFGVSLNKLKTEYKTHKGGERNETRKCDRRSGGGVRIADCCVS